MSYHLDPLHIPRTDTQVRIGIVGSRDFPHPDLVYRIVYLLPRNAVIVSGGAKGVDTWAEQVAKSEMMPTDIYHAEWAKYGKTAGFRRNNQLVRNSDLVLAFWHNKSKGTKHTISLCKYLNVPHMVFEC